MSRPSRSSSSVTRSPTRRSAILKETKATTAVHMNTTPTAWAWVTNCDQMEYSAAVVILPVNQSTGKLGPPSFGELKTPVSSAPRMPPTACTPKTSSASSAPSNFFRPFTPHRHTKPAARPMTNAPGMPTLPAAGVIATRPATAPDAAPTMLGLPLKNHSPNIQERTAQAVARKVFMNASAAKPLASSAEPALKPNQPTQRSAAPTMVMVTLCGDMASFPKPTRFPTRYAPTSPATPELMCTTVPPAKSRAPHCHRRPAFALVASTTLAAVYASGPGQNHTMCATGA